MTTSKPEEALMICSLCGFAFRDWHTCPTIALRDRADSYWRDAVVFRQDDDVPMAVAYETISAELRRAAEDLGDSRMGEPSGLGNGAER